MMKYYLRSLLMSLCIVIPSCVFSAMPQSRIIVNNRVIAKVNGNPISVVDVMKKMDLMFYQEHPDHLDSVEMRYQFYRANWKDVVQGMIDRELVVKDAEEQNMPVSAGDIREEVEEIFGPDVLGNLEQAGLTYEEAAKLIRSDIMIRRMLAYAVNLKAMKKVTPEDVLKAYELSKKEQYQDQIHFRILSVKSENVQDALALAENIKQILQEKKSSPDALSTYLEGEKKVNEGLAVTVSPVFIQKKNEIAPHVYEMLSKLAEGAISEPSIQKSAVRLYLLEKNVHVEPPELYEVEDSIREMLIRKAMHEESERYFGHLRKYYDVKADDILAELPDTFTPFEIK